MHPGKLRSIFVVAAIVCAVSQVASNAFAGTPAIATFENFDEGNAFHPSFTDPASGITFSDSTSANANFVIEYATNSSWSAPMFQGNRYMTGNGFVPGDGASMGARFGFTATLPQPARFVELDMAGRGVTGTYSVSLVIQNSSGTTLGSQTVTFNPDEPQQHHMRVDSQGNDVARFLVTTGTSGFNAVDNINFVPEPSAGVFGMAMLVAMLRRSDRRA
jgi:hypothetical protein